MLFIHLWTICDLFYFLISYPSYYSIRTGCHFIAFWVRWNKKNGKKIISQAEYAYVCNEPVIWRIYCLKFIRNKSLKYKNIKMNNKTSKNAIYFCSPCNFFTVLYACILLVHHIHFFLVTDRYVSGWIIIIS